MTCKHPGALIGDGQRLAEHLRFIRRASKALGPLVETIPRIRRLEWPVRDWAWEQGDQAEAAIFWEREDKARTVGPATDLEYIATCVAASDKLYRVIENDLRYSCCGDAILRQHEILVLLKEVRARLDAWAESATAEGQNPKWAGRGPGRPSREYQPIRRAIAALLQGRIEQNLHAAAHRVARWVAASWRGYEILHRKTMEEIKAEEIADGRGASDSVYWTDDTIARLWAWGGGLDIDRHDPEAQLRSLTGRFRVDYLKSVGKPPKR